MRFVERSAGFPREETRSRTPRTRVPSPRRSRRRTCRPVADLDVDESRFFEHLLPARTGQPAGDSAGPEVDVAQRLGWNGPAVGDVGELQPAARAEHAADLGEHGALVGAEVDDAVGDDDVGPAVVDRAALRRGLRGTRRGRSRARRRSRATSSSISAVMSMPTTRPVAPTCAAAMKESNPAPEPTSTTRSPGSSAPQRERVADSGERFDRAVRQRVDDRGVVAEARRERPARVEVVRPRAGRARPRGTCRAPARAARRVDEQVFGHVSSLLRPRREARRVAIREAVYEATSAEALRVQRTHRVVGVHADTGRGSTRRPRRPSGSARRCRRSSPIGTERAPAMWPAAYSASGRTSSTTTSRRLQPRGQLRAVDRLDAVALAEVRLGEPLEPGDVRGSDVAQRRQQLGDPVAREPVVDAGAVAAGRDEPGAGHRPQVMRRVRDALVDLVGDLLDRPLALREHVDDLAPASARRAPSRSRRSRRRARPWRLGLP